MFEKKQPISILLTKRVLQTSSLKPKLTWSGRNTNKTTNSKMTLIQFPDSSSLPIFSSHLHYISPFYTDFHSDRAKETCPKVRSARHQSKPNPKRILKTNGGPYLAIHLPVTSLRIFERGFADDFDPPASPIGVSLIPKSPPPLPARFFMCFFLPRAPITTCKGTWLVMREKNAKSSSEALLRGKLTSLCGSVFFLFTSVLPPSHYFLFLFYFSLWGWHQGREGEEKFMVF